MAKQLNIDMRFQADTSQAKQAIMELQKTLDQALSSSRSGPGGIAITKEIEQARLAAAQLKAQLKDATNVDGSLNLAKFNQALTSSGQTLASYGKSLSALGPTGQQAFAQLAQSISAANVSFTKSAGLINTMWTTLKNVARFQISSSIMHGIIGGIQAAYGYAQDLNQSLNNIRIVTGQSTDQMARFAEQANKTARSLSASTLDYTDAALIYYQQGLSDAEVKARTDVTIKLANVSRQSAEEVSSQMTAIWNNFDDGSHSMEYFADVITALGATTASSSEEIAKGLSQFAPIAGTIGLSYDKAASAMAAIIANTRQSAETVGTGLRTIFSRFESLKLGETLEDGVDLNKYTKAMQTIGVNVLDANGKLRDMDSILDDVAANWEKLDNTQKTAFATTVGGVRQYTNLMALFENWDDVQKNMITATTSGGTLQDQADTYAESWEAARDRVKTAAQSIYTALIDEDFFIGFDKFLEKNLDGLSLLIKALGGLPGVLSLVGATFLTAFGPQISGAIDELVQRLSISFGIINQQAIQMKQQASDTLRSLSLDKPGAANDAFQLANNSQANISDAIMKQQMTSKIEMSQIEKDTLAVLLEQHTALVNNTKQYGEQLQKAQELFDTEQKSLGQKASKTKIFSREDEDIKQMFAAAGRGNTEGAVIALQEKIRGLQEEANKAQQTLEDFLKGQGYDSASIEWILNIQKALSNTNSTVDDVIQKMYALSGTKTFDASTYDEQINKLKELSTAYAGLSAAQNTISKLSFKKPDSGLDDLKKDAETLKTTLESLDKQKITLPGVNTQSTIASINELTQKLNENKISAADYQKAMSQILAKVNSGLGEGLESNNEAVQGIFAALRQIIPPSLASEIDSLEQKFYSLSGAEEDAARGAEALKQSEGGIAEFLNSVKGPIGTLGSSFTSLASGLMSVASAYNSLKGVVNVWKDSDASTVDKIMSSMSSLGMVVLSLSRSYSALSKIKMADVKSSLQNIKADIMQAAANKAAGASAASAAPGITAKAGAEAADAVASEGAAAGTMSFAAALWTLLWPIGLAIVAIGALVAVIALTVKAYNKDAIAAKKAAAAAEELAEKSEQAKQKAQEIKDAFSQYDTAVEALEKCTAGTEEWYAALKKVNDEVLNILEQHPELASKLDITRENGQLKINNADEIIKEAEQNAKNAQYASLLGQQIANSAQLTADRTATLRSIDYENTTDEYGLTIDGAAERNTIRKTIVNNAEDYLGLTKDEFAKQISEQGLDLQGAALDKFYDSVMALAESAENAAISIRNSSEVIAEDVLGEEYKNNENSGAIKGFAAATLAQANQKAYDDAIKLSNNLGINSSANTLKNSEFFKKYVEAVGGNINDYIVSGNAVLGTDNNRRYKFIDDAGKEQTLSAEQMAAAIAASEATGGLSDVAAEFANKIPDIQEKNGGQALIDFLANNNFSQTSQVDLEALQNLVNENRDITEALNTILGEDLVEKLGPDFISGIEAKINSIDFNTITDKYVTPVRTTINQVGEDFKQLSSTEQREVGDFLTNFYANSSQEEYDAFNKTLAKISDTQKDEFLKLTTDYDWENGSLEDFKSQLMDLGIDVARINLNPWINAMLRAQEVINSFEDVDSKWANVNKIIGKLNIGDTLDSDKYQELINIDPIFEEYFIQLKDGSYRLMREIEEINDLETEERLKAIRDQEKRVNELKELQEREQNGEQTGFSAGEKHNIELGLTNPEIAARKGIDANHLAPESTLQMLNAMQGYNGQDFTDLIAKTKSGEGLTFEDLQHIDEQYTEYLNSIQEQQNALEEEYNKIAQSATDVGDLQDQAAKFGLSAESIQKGYESLATTTDEGRLALSKYRKEMENYEEGSEEAKVATDKFQKAIKDIQANKAADSIRKLYENYDELTDVDFDNIAKQLQTVFGKDITDEFVKNNKELVEQWLNGTEEERQSAANTIDIITGTQRILNDLDPTQSAEAMNYLIEQLNASSFAADMFANNWAKMQELITNGAAELNGITFNIDGSADMSNAVQSMIEAGKTAEEIASYIQGLNFSDVQFHLNGETITPPPSLMDDPEAFVEWWNETMAGRKDLTNLTASGKWVADSGIPQMASGGSGGGGGGGGGGGKTKSKEKKDPTDDKDRYHTITEKISDATNAYDELSKAEDRAFGKERVDAMKGMTDNLKLQIELQKQYLDEIRDYLVGDRAAVEALGATFDANGVITNYDALIDELVAKYNEGVDAFNAGAVDEDAFKEQYEEPFNKAKEAIDQYVETINLLQDEELNLIDLQNDLADELREIAAYKLELHIDLDEDELQYLDFLLEMLGDKAEDAADRLDLLGQQFNTNRDEISAYTTAIQDLLRLRGFTDDDVAAFIRGELTVGDLEERGFTTDDIDKLREYRDAIQDNTEAMNDLAQEIEDSFLDTLDELNDKVDDAEDRFNHFADMLEHFQNVVDIVGQDALGMSAETMELLARQAKDNAIEMVEAARTQLDSLDAVRSQAEAQLAAALEAQKNASSAEEKLRADEAVRYWSDTISEVTTRVEEAEKDLADALENALEGIRDMYTVMMEQTTRDFERSITGAAGSLEQLQNNFDRQKETQDLYIPTYEKIYELTKLTRDINNSIDDTDNLWSKQELAKLQDEINDKMADGVELTEHDVEELRKRYELKLAEAELEEAQSAKRTVRMSRDNEGNWSYVYTADEDDVAAAEQNYEDKLFQYQQMNYEYIQELQSNILQAEQDMTDAINDLDVTKFASKEAYLAEVQRIMDATIAKEQQYKDQLAQTLDQQGILYDEDWKRYNELTGYRMARDDQWVDNWDETILAQETGFDTLDEMFNELVNAIGGPDNPGSYVGNITDAYAEMQAANERALNAAGTSMQTYEQDVVNSVDNIDNAMEQTQDRVDEFSNSMVETMEGVSDFIGEWKNQYGDAVKSITEFNKDLYDSCNTLIKKLQDTFQVNADFEAAQAAAAEEALAGNNRGAVNTVANGETVYGGNIENGNNGFTPQGRPVTTVAYSPLDPASHTKLIIVRDSTTNQLIDRKEVVESHSFDSSGQCRLCHMQRITRMSWLNKTNQFKSGGYTGTWSAASGRTGMYTGSWNGPDLEENGRLAFLHQKELVLNAGDTENFLSAIDMVRQISSMIDLQAASRSSSLGLLLPGIANKEPETLDQNVHIEAHFPNVTSHSEIEEAFTNLVGKASQFANR